MVRNRPIFRLKGHHSSLVGIEAIEGSPQIITADVQGVFKLWDMRTFECVQTFSGSDPSPELASFTAVPSFNQIVAGGSKMYTFEYDKPGTPWMTSESPVVGATYNYESV
jgi:hypothetical protein